MIYSDTFDPFNPFLPRTDLQQKITYVIYSINMSHRLGIYHAKSSAGDTDFLDTYFELLFVWKHLGLLWVYKESQHRANTIKEIRTSFVHVALTVRNHTVVTRYTISIRQSSIQI